MTLQPRVRGSGVCATLIRPAAVSQRGKSLRIKVDAIHGPRGIYRHPMVTAATRAQCAANSIRTKSSFSLLL